LLKTHPHPDPLLEGEGAEYTEGIMAGITLTQAEAQLTAWLAADTAVASGQSYAIGGRSLTRANAGEIRENIDYWDAKVKKLSVNSTGGIKVFSGVPVDN
jgi:hypothetical protein